MNTDLFWWGERPREPKGRARHSVRAVFLRLLERRAEDCPPAKSANQHQRTTVHDLRRAEAVETTGIIRPLRIAEIGRAGGERVGRH